MTPTLEQDRPFLENLILNRLQEIKGIETGLGRQFASLKLGSAKARAPFVRQLAELQERALWLERLVDALDQAGEPRQVGEARVRVV